MKKVILSLSVLAGAVSINVAAEPVQYATSATYQMPSSRDSYTAAETAALWTQLELDEAGLESVVGDDSDRTLTFTCKSPGYYITAAARDLNNGEYTLQNIGPNGERAKWTYIANNFETIGWSSGTNAFNNVKGDEFTGLSCWELTTS